MALGAMCVLTLAALAVPSVHAATSTSQLTVNSESTNGSTINGFYTVLFNNSGSMVNAGFTPAMFTLNDSQYYTIQADSYGNCIFSQWSNGNIMASRNITISSDTTITAIYNCSYSSSSSVTISSVSQNGDAIFGYYNSLWSSGSLVSSGYTTKTYATNEGQSYTLDADSYGACTFSHWGNGDTSNSRSFTGSSGPLSFTAVYNCVPSSYANVRAVDQNGNPLTGYYTVLYDSNGNIVDQGYTPHSYSTLAAGAHYSVQVDSFGSCTFAHWDNGNTNNPRGFDASGQTFTAVYNCSSG